MPARPLSPVIGATENALRRLLIDALAGSPIGGYDEWIYLHVQGHTADPAQLDAAVSEALGQPAEGVVSVRTALVDAGVLGADGSPTGTGRDELHRCREMIAGITEALTAGIDPAAVQTTIDTLDTVRGRAERLLAR